MVIGESSTIKKYKDDIMECMQLFTPYTKEELSPIIDYSINKRYKKVAAHIDNSYKMKRANMSLLQIADYINDRKPIVTAHGVLFQRHGTVPNPLRQVVMGFLDARSQHKKQMYAFPKGSEDFEKYNLIQQLDKIDANGRHPYRPHMLEMVY